MVKYVKNNANFKKRSMNTCYSAPHKHNQAFEKRCFTTPLKRIAAAHARARSSRERADWLVQSNCTNQWRISRGARTNRGAWHSARVKRAKPHVTEEYKYTENPPFDRFYLLQLSTHLVADSLQSEAARRRTAFQRNCFASRRLPAERFPVASDEYLFSNSKRAF